MKIVVRWLTLLACAFFFGSALATPLDKKAEFAGGGLGKVTFDSKAHASKGIKCTDCHTKIFPMKKGEVKITMADMNAGKNCGTCHNGDKAFKSADPANCAKCHKK
jgi:c(7)-type cytochrome triheme protein